jgi:hypothetical protein
MGKRGKDDRPTRDTKQQVVSHVYSGGVTLAQDQHQFTTFGDPFTCIHISPLSLRVTVTNVFTGVFIPLPTTYGYDEQTTVSQAGAAAPTDPTFIGLVCGGGKATLQVNFETAMPPAVAGFAFNDAISPGPATPETSAAGNAVNGTTITTGCSQPVGLPLPFWDIETTSDLVSTPPPVPTSSGLPAHTYSDISSILINATGAIYSDVIEVTTNHWHHVLVSVDLREIIIDHGIQNAAQLFVALDDTNYTGFDLSSDSVGANYVLTDGALRTLHKSPQLGDKGQILGVPQYNIKNPVVPSGGSPLGLPATPQFVNNIHHVEMAEFQMWTGITLDTGKEENRRLFIDFERDDKGEPVDEELKPVSPKIAEKALGKRPDVMLHGSSKWKAGRNAGTAGALKPAGRIITYKPDPNLHGEQGEPQ